LSQANLARHFFCKIAVGRRASSPSLAAARDSAARASAYRQLNGKLLTFGKSSVAHRSCRGELRTGLNSPALPHGLRSASFGALRGLRPLARPGQKYSQRAMPTAECGGQRGSSAWVSGSGGIYEHLGIGNGRAPIRALDNVVANQYRLGEKGTRRWNAVVGIGGVLSEAMSLQAGIGRGPLWLPAFRRNDQASPAESARLEGAASAGWLGKAAIAPTRLNELQKTAYARTRGDVFNQTTFTRCSPPCHTRRGEKQKAFRRIEEAARAPVKVPNSSIDMILERSTIAEPICAWWEMHGVNPKPPLCCRLVFPVGCASVRLCRQRSKQS